MRRKKNNKKIGILLILIVVLIAIFAFSGHKSKKEEVDKISETEENTSLIILESYETKTIKENKTYSTFDVKYPYFKYADESFNLEIKSLLEEQISDQEKNAEEGWLARYNTQAPGDDIPKTPKNDDKWPFYSDFTIVQSNKSYISFTLLYGGFTGGAHGYENKISFNYDLKNKKVLTLKDMFSTNFDYLKYLSTETRKELEKQFATLSKEDKANSSPGAVQEYIDNMVSMIKEGTKPEESNFSIFTFTPEKIKIYFAQYQVGPHTIGMPEVEVNRK